ncbi:MAG: FtsH protease activity modulator HflK [Steroidobacter sp.]
MAWNDPGNSPGKRNPWEKRPGKPASSGLDEMIRHFKKKFSSTPAGGNVGASIGVALLVILALLWASTGLYQVDTGQVAVVTRFGKFQRIEQAGRNLHLPWPIEDVQMVNIADDEHKEQIRIVTRDESYIDVVYSLRFRRAEVMAYAFNLRDPDATLDELAHSAIREAFARETLATVLNTSRQPFANHARELIQQALDNCKAGIVVNGVDVVDVRVPNEVKSAQDEVTKAQSESAAAIARAREYRSDIIPKAQGVAVVKHEEAEGYKSERIAQASGEVEQFLKLLPEYQRAPAVTRERMYLETMESIYKNARKIFIDTRGGSTINLPLDKFATHADHDAGDNKSAAASSANAASNSRGNR